MPKKHGPKKRERERERERKGVTMSQKKRETGMIRERKAITSRSKPYPSIYPSTHTLAPFDRDCMTCFSMDHLFDFTIYGMQVCPILVLPWPPQRLVAVGKIAGRYCLGEDNKKLSVSRESSWELCHVFKNLSKKYLHMDCRSISKKVLLYAPF